MIHQEDGQIEIIQPYTYSTDVNKPKHEESFGMDASLTSLKWLQTLNCRSGLNMALQTPVLAPQPCINSIGGCAVINGSKTNNSLINQLPTVAQLDQAIKKQHDIDPNLDWTKSNTNKPPHNYAMLIYMSIRDSEYGKVTLNDIYGYIQTQFIFYRDLNQGWKNSIRHNLTQNKFFKKTVRPDNENAPSKGGFWTLNMSMQNAAEFSRGVWKLSKVKMKPASAKSAALISNDGDCNDATNHATWLEGGCGGGDDRITTVLSTPPMRTPGSKKTAKAIAKAHVKQGDAKAYKSMKNGKRTKVGKNGSPKNRRKGSASNCFPPIPFDVAPTSPNLLKQEEEEDVTDMAMNIEWPSLGLFSGDGCDFDASNGLLTQLYSDSDGSSEPDLQTLDDVDDLFNAPSTSDTDVVDAAVGFGFASSAPSPDVMTISAGSDGCFGLSNTLVKLSNDTCAIEDNSHAFDSLISSFEDITTDESLQLKDISLEVVGVSMSLLPPTPTATAIEAKNQRDLSAIMEEMDEPNFLQFQV